MTSQWKLYSRVSVHYLGHIELSVFQYYHLEVCNLVKSNHTRMGLTQQRIITEVIRNHDKRVLAQLRDLTPPLPSLEYLRDSQLEYLRDSQL